MTGRASSLTDRAHRVIREAILDGRLLPGHVLIEAQLARELQMSKTPVREALQRLASEDLVVLDRFRGAAVRPVSAELMRDLYEMRQHLEPLAVRQAVPRLAPDDLQHLDDALAAADAALAVGDIPALGQANRAFHEVFIEHATNASLRSVLFKIQDQIRIASLVIWLSLETRRREHHEHGSLLAAARRGDAEEARRLMADHLLAFSEDVLYSVEKYPNGVVAQGLAVTAAR